MPVTTNHGVSIVPGKGTTRIHIGCTHQKGLVYVVPAEKSWVCTEEMLPGHALAGFLGELTAQGERPGGGDDATSGASTTVRCLWKKPRASRSPTLLHRR